MAHYDCIGRLVFNLLHRNPHIDCFKCIPQIYGHGSVQTYFVSLICTVLILT